MKKLTESQKEALRILKEKKSVRATDCYGSGEINGNTMNGLYWKKLVTYRRYANGGFWELTDKGIEESEKL
jgi:hypothetical protein